METAKTIRGVAFGVGLSVLLVASVVDRVGAAQQNAAKLYALVQKHGLKSTRITISN